MLFCSFGEVNEVLQLQPFALPEVESTHRPRATLLFLRTGDWVASAFIK